MLTTEEKVLEHEGLLSVVEGQTHEIQFLRKRIEFLEGVQKRHGQHQEAEHKNMRLLILRLTPDSQRIKAWKIKTVALRKELKFEQKKSEKLFQISEENTRRTRKEKEGAT